MFRTVISMHIPINNKLFSKRFFSTCNNRCKADELTSQLNRQDQYLDIINKKINHVFIVSYINFVICQFHLLYSFWN